MAKYPTQPIARRSMITTSTLLRWSLIVLCILQLVLEIQAETVPEKNNGGAKKKKNRKGQNRALEQEDTSGTNNRQLTDTTNTQHESDNFLSVIFVVIGTLVIVLTIALVVIYTYRRRKKKQQHSHNSGLVDADGDAVDEFMAKLTNPKPRIRTFVEELLNKDSLASSSSDTQLNGALNLDNVITMLHANKLTAKISNCSDESSEVQQNMLIVGDCVDYDPPQYEMFGATPLRHPVGTVHGSNQQHQHQHQQQRNQQQQEYDQHDYEYVEDLPSKNGVVEYDCAIEHVDDSDNYTYARPLTDSEYGVHEPHPTHDDNNNDNDKNNDNDNGGSDTMTDDDDDDGSDATSMSDVLNEEQLWMDAREIERQRGLQTIAELSETQSAIARDVKYNELQELEKGSAYSVSDSESVSSMGSRRRGSDDSATLTESDTHSGAEEINLELDESAFDHTVHDNNTITARVMAQTAAMVVKSMEEDKLEGVQSNKKDVVDDDDDDDDDNVHGGNENRNSKLGIQITKRLSDEGNHDELEEHFKRFAHNRSNANSDDDDAAANANADDDDNTDANTDDDDNGGPARKKSTKIERTLTPLWRKEKHRDTVRQKPLIDDETKNVFEEQPQLQPQPQPRSQQQPQPKSQPQPQLQSQLQSQSQPQPQQQPQPQKPQPRAQPQQQLQQRPQPQSQSKPQPQPRSQTTQDKASLKPNPAARLVQPKPVVNATRHHDKQNAKISTINTANKTTTNTAQPVSDKEGTSKSATIDYNSVTNVPQNKRKASVANPIKKGTANSFKAPTSHKCHFCSKSVYQMEKAEADGMVFHINCLRCSHCNKVCSIGNYASLQGKIYCKPHFKQLFKSKGNYSEGFGEEQHKYKWDRANDTTAESENE